MSAGEDVGVPAALRGGSPGRKKAQAALNTRSLDDKRALIRECVWRAGLAKTSQRIVYDDVIIAGPNGKLGYLADLGLEEMIATVVEHSTLSRIRRVRQAKARTRRAQKKRYEGLPQTFKEKTK